MGFAEVFDQVGMKKPCTPRLGSGVSASGRADRSVAQELAYNLIVAGICIKEDFASNVTEQVRVKV